MDEGSKGKAAESPSCLEHAAAAFEQAGQPKLAQEIRQFVNAMSPALTEREHFVARAEKLLDKQSVKDHGRSRYKCIAVTPLGEQPLAQGDFGVNR